MKTETYYISEGQFLAQLEPFKTKGLPTDSIIHKELTGCGATTLELEFDRNSIIIEPNLPVIRGKCKKMNKGKRKHKVVLGVYEIIDVDDIREYIKNRGDKKKKILTTPEGFEKIIEAIGGSVYKDYFLLFDECEKAIQDIVFRKRIIDPIKHFFLFTNKAFVSATPIMPSDPRFKEFRHVVVKPDYVHKDDIKVFTTNNIVYQLKNIIDNYKTAGTDKGRKYFMFLKSTKRIRNIIQSLSLTDHAVYTSETSAKELKRNDIKAYDNINDKFGKYNFLTSRYFSALDIDHKNYACDPIIIMVSDPMAMEHTVIDPSTEAIQIIGRFRKPEKEDGQPEIKVIKDIYHISNYNTKLTSFTQQQIEAILKDKQILHKTIRTFKVSSDMEYFTKFNNEIFAIHGFSYFYRDGSPNYFIIDHWRYSETVKGYYKSAKSLIWRYKQYERFNVDKGYINLQNTHRIASVLALFNYVLISLIWHPRFRLLTNRYAKALLIPTYPSL